MNQAVIIGVHPLDKARNDFVLDLPVSSPVTHGMLQIKAVLKDNIVVSAEPLLGSMHRGVEKLFESRDYRQILMLANRHEWLSPITGEVGLAEMLEAALGITVPKQAVQLRKTLIDYSRVTSHLAFLAGFPFDNNGLSKTLRQHREELIAHQQDFIGNRMHPMITRIGGFTHSPSAQWLDQTLLVTKNTHELVQSLCDYIETQKQLFDIGNLTAQDISELSITGPVAHAGRVADRLLHLAADTQNSVKQLQQSIPGLIQNIDQPINVLLPKVPRIPEGEYAHSIETPLGTAKWFFVSRGDKMPYRLKLRPASLHTVLALSRALVGTHINDVKFVVASMPFITGDAER